MDNKLKFTKIKDGLPAFGEPVLLHAGGVLQNITYCREGDDDSEWLEPYHFDYDVELKISYQAVDSWIYIEDISLAEE